MLICPECKKREGMLETLRQEKKMAIEYYQGLKHRAYLNWKDAEARLSSAHKELEEMRDIILAQKIKLSSIHE